MMDVTKWRDSVSNWTRRLAMPMMALALAASFVTYECVKPVAANAANATAAPAAAPLDADSVGALMALDKAMETLAPCRRKVQSA